MYSIGTRQCLELRESLRRRGEQRHWDRAGIAMVDIVRNGSVNYLQPSTGPGHSIETTESGVCLFQGPPKLLGVSVL
jgi:hypothetical protein